MTTYTPRPHEEYLEWIDKELAYLDEHDQQLVNVKKNYRASLLANRDTLERHKDNGYEFCGVCAKVENTYFDNDGNLEPVMFPCPTYTDITKRLDEVME